MPANGAVARRYNHLSRTSREIRRQCQELPWLRDGLGLTERLVLQILTDGPTAFGDIFGILMRGCEPLPWPKERLTITDLGRAVLTGQVDFLSLPPPERWVGGVRTVSERPCWRWNDPTGVPTHQPATAART